MMSHLLGLLMLGYSATPPRVMAGGHDLQPQSEKYQEGETCSGRLTLSMSAGYQVAPPPRDPGIRPSPTLLPPGTCANFSCILASVCSFPFQILVSLTHSATLERFPFSGLFPTVTLDSAPFSGGSAPSYLTALCNCPLPVLAWGLRGPRTDSGCLSLCSRLQGGCKGGSQPALCSSSSKQANPPTRKARDGLERGRVRYRGQKNSLSGEHCGSTSRSFG